MMNKEEVSALIGKLAPEPREFNFVERMNEYTVLEDWVAECPSRQALLEACHIAVGHPIMIGDVLGKMKARTQWKPEGEQTRVLLHHWSLCGLKKSLQEIAEESGLEYIECIDPECECGKFPLRNESCEFKSRLKNQNARNLLEFLNKIFNERTTDN